MTSATILISMRAKKSDLSFIGKTFLPILTELCCYTFRIMIKSKSPAPPLVLIVDDTPGNLKYLSELLTSQGYDVRATSDGKLALEAASLMQPDLILLDIRMPGMDGYEVCRALQKNEKLTETPIIFISALDDVNDKVKAFKVGGVDYITKPFEENEVLARVSVQLQLYQERQTIVELIKQQDWFIKKIMHEMNTPVSVISLNCDSLDDEIGQRIQIDRIRASAKTLATIYDDLSYLVKKEIVTYESEHIDLVEFVSERISFFHELALIKNIDISLEVEEELTVVMNLIELTRILDNTLSNAIKYSHEDSTVTVALVRHEGLATIEVRDQGIGMENIEAIFEPYYQASGSHVGLGIGMATVSEICKKSGIDLTVNSQKEEGSTFLYRFPDSMVIST